MGFFGRKMGAMVVVVWVAMMAAAARGQTQSCVQELIPCGPYVNNATAKPPETCCGPLRNTVKNELPCLCAVYKTPELLKVFNISLDKAVELSHRCGITSNLSACNTAQAPGSTPPPATPGGNGSGGTHGATWFGISGLMSLFFFWWSILA